MKRLPYLDHEPPTVTHLIVCVVCLCAFSFVLGMFVAALIVGGF